MSNQPVEDEIVVTLEPGSSATVGAPTGLPGASAPASTSPDTFRAPPVMDGIEEATMAERLSSSLADLQSRVSSLVQDSSSTVTRALKNVVPPARLPRRSPYAMIIAFGDSLTERGVTVWDPDHESGMGTGWLALVGHYFAARADVVARGFSGYNTRCALHVLNTAMAGLIESATVVLIWFGTNDAVISGRGVQHVSVEEYGLHLAKLVFEIKSFRTVSPILPVVMTPPPVQDDMVERPRGELPLRQNSNTSRYASSCLDIAHRMNVPCIDVYNELSKHAGDQEGLKKYLVDGVHLSAAGNKFIAELVVRELRTQVSALSDENLTKWFHPWRGLDMNNLGAFFR